MILIASSKKLVSQKRLICNSAILELGSESASHTRSDDISYKLPITTDSGNPLTQSEETLADGDTKGEMGEGEARTATEAIKQKEEPQEESGGDENGSGDRKTEKEELGDVVNENCLNGNNVEGAGEDKIETQGLEDGEGRGRKPKETKEENKKKYNKLGQNGTEQTRTETEDIGSGSLASQTNLPKKVLLFNIGIIGFKHFKI